MARGGKTALLWAGVSLLAAAMAVTVTYALGGEPAPARGNGPLAVVLLPQLDASTLAVVDLESGELVRRIALRSLVTDIAVDEKAGVVVGAQSGGVGAAADDAASLIDPRTGAVRYVTLPWPDPARVACTGGRAYLMHSVVEPEGLTVSVVDPVRASVISTGHAPDGPGAWTAAGGSLWSLAMTSGPAPFELVGVRPDALTPRVRDLRGIVPNSLAQAEGTLLVLGRERGTSGPEGSARVGLVEEGGELPVSGPLAGLAHIPTIATIAGNRLVVGDWTGEAPESRQVWTLHADTLRSAGALPVDGVPCALGAWEGRLLVVDREGGRLLQMDPVSGRTLATTDLGVRDLVYSRVVVVPRP